MKIRLTKRFSEFLDGIDLTRARTGEALDLSDREAALLVLEGWATPIDGHGPTTAHAAADGAPPQRRTRQRRTLST